MRQVWLTKTGGPEALVVKEAPDPIAKAGHVCIAVEAAGINFADLMARKGLYPDAPPLPTVVGYEVGGTVQAVGEGVTGFKEGDAVFALTRFGGYSSQVAVPVQQVYHRPDGMSAEVGAALPVNYLTAFQAMVVMGGIRRPEALGGIRQRVLVHSAAGGVGTAAADLGKLFGVEMLGTASPGKHAYVHERGYAHAINYGEEDWPEQIQALTNGRGVDLILDAVGGANWAKSLHCLAPTGRLVVFGFSAAAQGVSGKLSALGELARVPWLKFNPMSLMNANHGILGVNLGHLWRLGDEVRQWGEQLVQYYQQGHLSPQIDRVFSFEEAPAAHAYIEARKNRGKVLLRP